MHRRWLTGLVTLLLAILTSGAVFAAEATHRVKTGVTSAHPPTLRLFAYEYVGQLLSRSRSRSEMVGRPSSSALAGRSKRRLPTCGEPVLWLNVAFGQ